MKDREPGRWMIFLNPEGHAAAPEGERAQDRRSRRDRNHNRAWEVARTPAMLLMSGRRR